MTDIRTTTEPRTITPERQAELWDMGMRKLGFNDGARKVRNALIQSYNYFNTPTELFTSDDEKGFGEWIAPHGQRACQVQAWSAAALLALLTTDQ